MDKYVCKLPRQLYLLPYNACWTNYSTCFVLSLGTFSQLLVFSWAMHFSIILDNFIVTLSNCPCPNCLDIDKCDPIYGLRPLHMHTISGMNKYESVSWSASTTSSLSSRDRVSLNKYTTLTCIIFSATLSVIIIYSILICDYPMYDGPYSVLKDLKLRNANRIICAQLNINSIRNKYDQLKSMITGNIDILITETKLNETFPQAQFFIDGFSKPYRLDRAENGGGVMVYVSEDIPTKVLLSSPMSNGIESIFIEINFRNRKWLICGTLYPS